jgi:hypothetical protein
MRCICYHVTTTTYLLSEHWFRTQNTPMMTWVDNCGLKKPSKWYNTMLLFSIARPTYSFHIKTHPPLQTQLFLTEHANSAACAPSFASKTDRNWGHYHISTSTISGPNLILSTSTPSTSSNAAFQTSNSYYFIHSPVTFHNYTPASFRIPVSSNQHIKKSLCRYQVGLLPA